MQFIKLNNAEYGCAIPYAVSFHRKIIQNYYAVVTKIYFLCSKHFRVNVIFLQKYKILHRGFQKWTKINVHFF